MEEYLARLRHQVVSAFQREAQVGGTIRRMVRVRLNSGHWIDGRLINSNDATFTVEIQRDQFGGNSTHMEVPYLSVAAIEHFLDRE